VCMAMTSTLGISRGLMLALGAFLFWALTEPRRTRTTATLAGLERGSPKCWWSAPSMVGHPLPALVKRPIAPTCVSSAAEATALSRLLLGSESLGVLHLAQVR
jgi:hypothetical protein